MHFWSLSCEYFTAYPSRTKTFKPSEIYPSRALSPCVTIWLLAAAAWSLLPPSPLSVLLHSIFHSPPVATDSLPLQWWPLHCMQEQQACAAACSAASQHPDGLHSCCCVPAHRLHPPHTHTEPGIQPEPWPEQSTLPLPGPRNGEHLSFFMGY